MDVPSWHPANEDASLTRQLMASTAAASQRTEFKLMAGSTADTSTDAGRELLSELTRGAAVEGRGFFDSSDRMYLQEQKRLAAERQQQKRDLDRAELEMFRSTALKVQAQKAAAIISTADLHVEAKKRMASSAAPPVVRIKPKKRGAASANESAACSTKPTKQRKAREHSTRSESKQPDTTVIAKPAVKTTAAAAAPSLLLGYSSCSDSDGENENDSKRTSESTSTGKDNAHTT